MKRGPQKSINKKLSIKNLLETITDNIDFVEPVRKDTRGLTSSISTEDCWRSAFAIFSLKMPSLLAFDKVKKSKTISHNLQSLYQLNKIPCDTYMREKLDLVDPSLIKKAFSNVFQTMQRAKLLERYAFLNGTYLCAVDGTQVFESNEIYCDNCCIKIHKNAPTSYYHQILSAVIMKPGLKQVLPFCPEPILKQDGATKNDCEANALKRLLPSIKAEHPKLKLTIVADALSANTPSINFIKKQNYDFIINVKPSGNKSLFEFLTGITLSEFKHVEGKNIYTFRYINNVPINDHAEAPNVNFLECKMIEIIGKTENQKTFTWVTSHKITNKNAYELMLGGRARWKIENETFNTLKNQGYQFEHNFGHGKKNLHTIFAMTMMLAFFVDQVQEAACGLFQAAIKSKYCRRDFWECLRAYFRVLTFNDWEKLFSALINEEKIESPFVLARKKDKKLSPNSC